MGDFFSTLKQKAGPLPVWAWAAIGTVLLAAFMIFRKSKSSSTTNDQAAADQTNSNLGSAAELANMFEVAGLMPYQGGDVYVNTTQTNNPPAGPVTTPPPDTTPIMNPPVNTPVTHPVVNPPKTTPVASGPPKPAAIYVVKSGDNLTAIAKKYGVTEAKLWAYNITKGVRPAATIATLKARGPNLLYSNEKIYIPPKSW